MFKVWLGTCIPSPLPTKHLIRPQVVGDFNSNSEKDTDGVHLSRPPQ